MTSMSSLTYADRIDSQLSRPQRAIRQSCLGHRESLEELWSVWRDCQLPNWDGFQALPVKQETYQAAYRLIESLPLRFPRPSIGAEPDGQLTLEWRKSARRTLSVSVDPTGYLHYAGLYGANRRYGRLAFYSEVPAELIQLVSEL